MQKEPKYLLRPWRLITALNLPLFGIHSTPVTPVELSRRTRFGPNISAQVPSTYVGEGIGLPPLPFAQPQLVVWPDLR